jgi:hypothetical protein
VMGPRRADADWQSFLKGALLIRVRLWSAGPGAAF